MLKIFAITVLLLIFNHCGGSSSSGGGALDTTFSSDGKQTQDFGNSDTANALAIRGNGQIIVAGTTDTGSAKSFAIAQFDSSGNLDTSFGTAGMVTQAVNRTDSIAYGIAIQNDNRFLVAGSTNAGGGEEFAIVRYNSNGAVDTTFGSNGSVIVSVGSSENVARSVLLQGDGKVLVSGYSKDNSRYKISVIRLLTSGQLDTSFDTDGKKAITVNSSSNDRGYAAILQSDGKLLISGSTTSSRGVDMLVVRLNTDGSVDTSFGTSGFQTIDFSGGDDEARGININSSQRILVSGFAQVDSATKAAVTSLLSTGTIDSSFGTSGRTSIGVCAQSSLSVTGSAIDSQNRLILSAIADPEADASCGSLTSNDFAVIRVRSTGLADSSFGTGGVSVQDFSSGRDEANAVVIDASGRVLVVGSAQASGLDFGLLRMNN